MFSSLLSTLWSLAPALLSVGVGPLKSHIFGFHRSDAYSTYIDCSEEMTDMVDMVDLVDMVDILEMLDMVDMSW